MPRFRLPRFVCGKDSTMNHPGVCRMLLLAVALLVAAPAPLAARQETETSALPDGVSGEVLADMEIPADALPDGETAAMLARFTWQPNSSSMVPAGTFERGILVDVLLEGSYGMRSGGPLHIERAGSDGAVEEIAAADNVVLETGDAVLYLENHAFWDFRNESPSEPGMALEALIITTDPPALPVESVVDPEHVDDDLSLHLEVLGRVVPTAWSEGATGPLTLTIWRGELASGKSIPVPAAGVVQLVTPESGAVPELTISPDGSARNDGPDAVSILGLTVTP